MLERLRRLGENAPKKKRPAPTNASDAPNLSSRYWPRHPPRSHASASERCTCKFMNCSDFMTSLAKIGSMSCTKMLSTRDPCLRWQSRLLVPARLGGARRTQHVAHRIVAFMARVLEHPVGGLALPRKRQRPGSRPRSRVVDRRRVLERVLIEHREPLGDR